MPRKPSTKLRAQTKAPNRAEIQKMIDASMRRMAKVVTINQAEHFAMMEKALIKRTDRAWTQAGNAFDETKRLRIDLNAATTENERRCRANEFSIGSLHSDWQQKYTEYKGLGDAVAHILPQIQENMTTMKSLMDAKIDKPPCTPAKQTGRIRRFLANLLYITTHDCNIFKLQ